jgi:hypothetical protein
MDVLLVIDMQRDFIDGALGTPQAQAIVEPAARRAEDFDGMVIFTRDTHQADYLDTQEGRNLPVAHCVYGTPGWQIHPRLAPLCRNVVDKPAFGSAALVRAAGRTQRAGANRANHADWALHRYLRDFKRAADQVVFAGNAGVRGCFVLRRGNGTAPFDGAGSDARLSDSDPGGAAVSGADAGASGCIDAPGRLGIPARMPGTGQRAHFTAAADWRCTTATTDGFRRCMRWRREPRRGKRRPVRF